jgi:fatty acid desaturase
LREAVQQSGILDRSYYFYFTLCVAAFGGYALSAWAIYSLAHPLTLGLACLSFSFFSTQLAGIMHDSGHRAVFKSVLGNDLLGLASSAAIGLVFVNWTTRHNAHHAYPNQEGKDPDIEVPFIAVTESDFRRKDAFQKRLLKWQAFYYYPLGGIVSFSNRLGTVSYFVENGFVREFRRLVAYLPAIILLFVLPFIVFPLDKALFVFLVVHITTGIYLASCFAPNHKGMPILPNESRLPFVERQILTSRNIRGGLFTDIMLVGLNHQVEHHLFPSCPRNKLVRLQPLVRQTCRELDLEFAEESIWRTNALILQRLHRTSRASA